MPKIVVSNSFKSAVGRIATRTQLSGHAITETLGRHLLAMPDQGLDRAFGLRSPRRRLHRKGQLEILLFLVIVFALGVIALFMVPLFDQEKNVLVGLYKIPRINASLSDDAETASLRAIDGQDNFLDVLVMGIALSLTIASVWVSSRIHSLPMFIGLVVFWLILSGVLSLFISNLWGDLTTGAFQSYAARLPNTNRLFTYFWGYALINVVLSSIVFYAGRQGAGQEVQG
jgi:hypothetical protein